MNQVFHSNSDHRCSQAFSGHRSNHSLIPNNIFSNMHKRDVKCSASHAKKKYFGTNSFANYIICQKHMSSNNFPCCKLVHCIKRNKMMFMRRQYLFKYLKLQNNCY